MAKTRVPKFDKTPVVRIRPDGSLIADTTTVIDTGGAGGTPTPDAGTNTKGKIKLSGALGGSADNPTALGLSDQNALQALIAARVQTGPIADSDTLAPNARAVRTAISDAVSGLVSSSPAALDTLNELAAALGNDANFAASVNAAIAAKASLQSGALNANAAIAPNAAAVVTALSQAVATLASMASLNALIARVAALEAGVGSGTPAAPPPAGETFTGAVGATVYFPLPAGVLGTIYVQRNGVDIPGAVSAPNSNGYAYTLVQADDQQPLTIRVPTNSITYDTSAAQRYSIQITDAERDTIEIVYSKTLQMTTISGSHFTLTGITGKTMTLVSATLSNGPSFNVLKLKYSNAFVYGDNPQLTLIQNGTNDFTDYAGNLIPTFTNLAVANNIESPPVPQASNASNWFNDGTYGYFDELGGIVSHGFNGDAYDAYLLTAQSTGDAAAVETMYSDGWIEMQCPDASASARWIGLSLEKNDNQLDKNKCLLKFAGGVLQAARGIGGGQAPVTFGPTFTFPSPSAACWTRLRRSGDAITVDYSVNNRSTWTVLTTFPTPQVDPLYGRLGVAGPNVPLKGVGLKGFSPEGSVST